jgi:hypothetical protein
MWNLYRRNSCDYNPESIIKFFSLIRHVAVKESQFTFWNLAFCTVKLCSYDWGIWQTFVTCGCLPRCGNGALVCFPLIVTECDTWLRNHQCLFPCEVDTCCCFPVICLCLTNMQVTYRQCLSFGRSSGQVRVLFGKCTWMWMFAQ